MALSGRHERLDTREVVAAIAIDERPADRFADRVDADFLESGVILRVTPTVDTAGRIMLSIHPEVSTGNIVDGVPSQATTEVTTRLLVPSGRTVFIGGLMKHSLTERNQGVPGLKRVPVLSSELWELV